MSAESRAFNSRLARVVADRLRQGQSRDSLLRELEGRLPPESARAVLEAAESGLTAARSAAPGSWAARGLILLIALWTVALAAQNLALLNGLRAVTDAYDGAPPDWVAGKTVLAVVKIALLAAALAAFLLRRGRLTAVLLALAILYAFPLRLALESALIEIPESPQPPAWRVLLSASALISYAACGALAWLAGRRARGGSAPHAFV